MVSSGQLLFSFVVIEDTNIESNITPLLYNIMRSNTAVQNQHTLSTLSPQALKRLDIGAIALFNTVRDIERRIYTAIAQKAYKDRGRGCPINIEITKYCKLLTINNGIGNIFSHFRHTRHRKRIRKILSKRRG